MSKIKEAIMRSFLLPVLVGFVVFGSTSNSWAQASRPAQNPPTASSVVKIRVDGTQVSAEIRDALMQQVLEELAARTGVVFEVSMASNPLFSVNLYRVPLQEAIKRVIGGLDAIFYYDKDEVGQTRIHFVRVFSKEKKSQPAGIRYIGTGVPTKTSEDSIDTPEQALKALWESQNIDLRQKAIAILASVKGEVATQALTKALEDSAPEVRVAAIEGLASLGAPSALPQILLTLKDNHPSVRQSATEAVALLGSVENVNDLKPLVRDKDEGVAGAAELAIRRLSARRP